MQFESQDPLDQSVRVDIWMMHLYMPQSEYCFLGLADFLNEVIAIENVPSVTQDHNGGCTVELNYSDSRPASLMTG